MECTPIEAIQDFFSKDTNRIQGRVLPGLAANSPYLSVIDTETFPAGTSDIQRAVVTQMIPPQMSLTTPAWTAPACEQGPEWHPAGSDEYQYQLEEYFGASDPICLRDGYSSVRGNLTAFEKNYEILVTLYWNAWLRAKLVSLAATKVVAYDDGTVSFSDLLTEGLGTNFAAGIKPNSGLTFQFARRVVEHLIHAKFANFSYQFGSGEMRHLRAITDQATIDGWRRDPAVREDLRAGVAGRFTDKYDELYGYTFRGPYQGLAFAYDETILRACDIVNGVPQYVEPLILQAATNGVKAVINPAWLAAPYQVSIIMAKGSFKRLIAEEWLGEGSARFEKQFYMGQLQWFNQRDWDCNIRGDKGFWYWNMAAAIRPERPEFVAAILHGRCQDNLGLEPCDLSYYRNDAGAIIC